VNVATRPLALLLALLAGFALAACSSGSASKFPKVLEVKQGEVLPVLANSELVVGKNRFALGILDPEGVPIIDARVHLAFYDLTDGKETRKFEIDAVSRVPARDAGLEETVRHTHTDGSTHTHVNAGEEIGVYTAWVDFDRAGEWGVEIQLSSDSPKLTKTIRPRFNVIAKGSTPAIGAAAPRSRNLTAADVTDISQIDSSATPSPEMHTSTIADAIAAGKPTLVLFAVPGYCSSRLCGPELEIMRKLYPRYKGRAEFIHVEFYDKPSSPSRLPVPAVVEWNLRTEPWFFVIDAKGIITAKFEGPVSLQELDEALKAVTSQQ
jgi:hypothetical protein